jgi:hypothetical protein
MREKGQIYWMRRREARGGNVEEGTERKKRKRKQRKKVSRGNDEGKRDIEKKYEGYRERRGTGVWRKKMRRYKGRWDEIKRQKGTG